MLHYHAMNIHNIDAIKVVAGRYTGTISETVIVEFLSDDLVVFEVATHGEDNKKIAIEAPGYRVMTAADIGVAA